MSSSELGMLCYVMLEWNNIQLITPTELLKAASPCFSLRNEHKKKKWQLHSRSDKIHLWSRIMHIGCKEQRWKPCWCISNPLHDCIVCDTWTCILKKKPMYVPFWGSIYTNAVSFVTASFSMQWQMSQNGEFWLSPIPSWFCFSGGNDSGYKHLQTVLILRRFQSRQTMSMWHRVHANAAVSFLFQQNKIHVKTKVKVAELLTLHKERHTIFRYKALLFIHWKYTAEILCLPEINKPNWLQLIGCWRHMQFGVAHNYF